MALDSKRCQLKGEEMQTDDSKALWTAHIEKRHNQRKRASELIDEKGYGWSARCSCYRGHNSSSGRCTCRGDWPQELLDALVQELGEDVLYALDGVVDPTSKPGKGARCKRCRERCQ